MKYEINPELAPAMAALTEQAAGAQVPGRGDWKALREAATAGLTYLATLDPACSAVKAATFFMTLDDGTRIEL